MPADVKFNLGGAGIDSDHPIPVEVQGLDVEIGAVEIKNSSDDTRATVGANGLYADVRNIQAGARATRFRHNWSNGLRSKSNQKWRRLI